MNGVITLGIGGGGITPFILTGLGGATETIRQTAWVVKPVRDAIPVEVKRSVKVKRDAIETKPRKR